MWAAIGEAKLTSKILTATLVGAFLWLAACNTVRGAATDIESAANCTENAIRSGRC